MPRDDSAAAAANWRTVLAVDAALGVGLSLAGLVTALVYSFAIGVAMVVLGSVYATLVVVRARRWSRIRRSGGTESAGAG